MSFLVWLIVVVAVLIFIGFVFRLLTGMAAIILPLALAGFLILGALWVISDVNQLRAHFYNDNKLFLLDIDGGLAGGFTMDASGIPQPLGNLTEMRNEYPDLAMMQGDYYKVIVLTWPVVADDINMPALSASKEELREALLSNTPKRLVINKTAERLGTQVLPEIREQVDAIYPTQDAFRSMVFAILATKPLSDPQAIMDGYKAGTVRVWPETVTFKLIKSLPSGLTNWMIPVKEDNNGVPG